MSFRGRTDSYELVDVAIHEHHPRFPPFGITRRGIEKRLVNDLLRCLRETRPHALAFGARTGPGGRRLVGPQLPNEIVRGPGKRRDRVDGRPLAEALDVPLLAFGPPRRQFALPLARGPFRGWPQISGAPRPALALNGEVEDPC